MTSAGAIKKLKRYSSQKRKKANEWFFKTGKGEYGEGDKFIGVSMPNARKVAKEFTDLPLIEIRKLIRNKIHEVRMLALLILTYKYKKSNDKDKEKIYKFYLRNTKYINNWDLVDVSAHKIIGAYLFNKSRRPLYKLSSSKNLWEQRISIISCFAFINAKDFEDALKISEKLLNHKHDLIHKAVGWMLREIGKKDEKVLKKFLKKHYKNMPRTMLRYAIEKFSKIQRDKYLKGKI